MSTDVRLGSNVVDLVRGELRSGAGTLSLSPLEASLLAYLGRRQGTVVAKDELQREVWGYRDGLQTRAVDATLIRVRKKIAKWGLQIGTVRGRGVALHVESTPEPDEQVTLPVGRREAHANLEALLEQPGLVCLWGPHGVGKSALAACVRHGHVLQGMGSDALEQELCRVFGCAPSALLSELAQRPIRLVLDDAEGRASDVIELVRAWSRVTPVLVVSVPRIEADREHRLEPLSDAAATEVLVQRTGLPVEQAAALVARTDRLPQELVLLSGALGFLGVDAFVELDAQGSFPVMKQAVEAVFDGLEANEKQVLVAVSVFVEQFDVAAAAFVTGMRPYAVLPVLESLWQSAMVQGERGVFRLLGPVREVASRHLGEPDALFRWVEWLLLENVQGGHRFIRHFADIRTALEIGPDTLAPQAGALLLEHWLWNPQVAQVIEGAMMRNGRVRPVVRCLRALLAAWAGEPEQARTLLALQARPLATPGEELVRQAALLASGPSDTDGADFLALADSVPLPLFANVLCIVGATHWVAPAGVFERFAVATEHADLPGSAVALRTWAARSARARGDDSWKEHIRRGSMEGRVSVELYEGDPQRAVEVALELLPRYPSRERKQILAGLAASVLAALGETERARALVDRYPSSGRGLGFYLQLARLVLGLPAVFPHERRAALVERWRAGERPSCELGLGDYPFRWVLHHVQPPTEPV